MVGMKKTELAEAVGVVEGTVRKWLRGDSVPYLDQVRQIARITGFPLEWLVQDEPLEAGEGPSTYGANDERVVFIPRFEVRPAAGAGGAVESERARKFLAFREDWIRENGWRAADLAVVTAQGDSMEPVISPGSVLLVDRGERAKQGREGIFILRMGEDLLVKRLQPLEGGRVLAKSDNPAYSPFEIKGQEDSETAVVGRVVWVGKRV